MGFGILIAGYYMTYLLGMIWKKELWGGLLILLGCVVIAMALLRLSEYEGRFRYAQIFNALMLLPALYRILKWLSDNLLWDAPFFSEKGISAVGYVEFALFFGFGVALLAAIRSLATDVEETKTVLAATRNLAFLGIYAVLWVVASLPFEFARYFALSAMLVQLVYLVLMGVMLVGCYMRICDESDADMPLRKSRFAWVNRIREARAEREQRAADSVTEYAERKLRRQREERGRRLSEQRKRKK